MYANDYLLMWYLEIKMWKTEGLFTWTQKRFSSKFMVVLVNAIKLFWNVLRRVQNKRDVWCFSNVLFLLQNRETYCSCGQITAKEVYFNDRMWDIDIQLLLIMKLNSLGGRKMKREMGWKVEEKTDEMQRNWKKKLKEARNSWKQEEGRGRKESVEFWHIFNLWEGTCCGLYILQSRH